MLMRATDVLIWVLMVCYTRVHHLGCVPVCRAASQRVTGASVLACGAPQRMSSALGPWGLVNLQPWGNELPCQFWPGVSVHVLCVLAESAAGRAMFVLTCTEHRMPGTCGQYQICSKCHVPRSTLTCDLT